MKASLGARVLLMVGCVAASFAFSGFIASRTVFDPSATKTVAHDLLTTKVVQSTLAKNVRREVDKTLNRSTADPKVKAAVAQAMTDPRVINAFADALATAHAALLHNAGGTITLDGRELTAAVHDALAGPAPQLAKQLNAQPPLQVQLDGKKLPHLGDTRDIAHLVTALGALAALLFISASLLVAHDRRAIRRVGRRIAYIALPSLVLFVVLPYVLDHINADVTSLAATTLRSYQGRVIPFSVAIVIAGITVMFGSLLIPKPRAAESIPPAPKLPAAPDPTAMPNASAPAANLDPLAPGRVSMRL